MGQEHMMMDFIFGRHLVWTEFCSMVHVSSSPWYIPVDPTGEAAILRFQLAYTVSVSETNVTNLKLKVFTNILVHDLQTVSPPELKTDQITL